MICPYCQHPDTKILETRAHPSGSNTRRRRRCTECDSAFYTVERLDTAPLVVAKRHGVREDFDRKRLVDSMAVGGAHSMSEQRREAVADAVIARLSDRGPLVTSYEIGETVLECLKEADILTYVRYALFFKRPHDASDFADWLAEHSPEGNQDRLGEAIIVCRKDGTREVFDSKILLNELIQACRGREAVSAELVEQEAQSIEKQLRIQLAGSDSTEVSTGDIDELALRSLRRIDPLAYLSYAAIHKPLDTFSKIQAELTALNNGSSQ
jgi:transcriptional repressor NrdR